MEALKLIICFKFINMHELKIKQKTLNNPLNFDIDFVVKGTM